MASAEKHTDSAGMTDGSDEVVQEMFCEHCDKEKETIVTAEGFCVECLEYMCSTCLYYHKKYVRDHTLQSKTGMPQDFCKEKCSIHPKEIVKYFCEACDSLACPECRRNDHVQCQNVSYIPTLVQTTKNSDELKELEEKINIVSDDLAAAKDDLDSNIKEVDANRLETVSDIAKHKENIKKQLKAQSEQIIQDIEKKKKEAVEKLEQEIKELVKNFDQEKKDKNQWLETQQTLLNDQIDVEENVLSCENMNQNDTKSLQQLLSKTNLLEADLSEVKQQMDKTKKELDKCVSFVAVQKAKQEVKQTEKEIENIRIDNDISYYVFESKGDTIDINEKFDKFNFGCLKEKSKVKRTVNRTQWSLLLGQRYITGLCQATDSTLVAVGTETSNQTEDLKKFTVTLIDTTKYRVIYNLYVSSEPFDVATVNANHVAVTQPGPGLIQFVTITENNELVQDHDIKAGENCFGIVYKKPNLVVSYKSPPKVKILALNGTVLQIFDTDSNGHDMFMSPQYLALSPNHKILYIQDNCCIKSMDFEGKLINALQCKQKCSGLTIDQAGTVYTTCLKYIAVSQISADLNTEHRIISVPLRHGTYFKCFFYNKMENILYVVARTSRRDSRIALTTEGACGTARLRVGNSRTKYPTEIFVYKIK